MKRSLRVTLLTVLLGLTFLTCILLGISSYQNAQSTARDLSNQVIDQVTLRVRQQVDDLTQTAIRLAAFNRDLRLRQLQDRDLTEVSEFWVKTLGNYPTVSGIYLTLAEEGQSLMVLRESASKEVRIQQILPGSKPGTMSLVIFQPHLPLKMARLLGALATPLGPLTCAAEVQMPGIPVDFIPDRPGLDLRHWDWYQHASRTGKPTWSDVNYFLDLHGEPSHPGLTYSMPIHRTNGKLLGVLGIDFHLSDLAEFLGKVEVSPRGFAFLIERRDDGALQLLAHPNPETLLPTGVSKQGRLALARGQDLSDPRLANFFARMPGELDPHKLRGMTRLDVRSGRMVHLAAYRGLEDPQGPDWVVCVMLPEDDVLAGAKRNLRTNLLLGLAVALLALLLSLITARTVARPLELLSAEAEKVGRLELTPRPDLRSRILEVDRLALATEDMKTSLRSFRKYVPAELVKQLFDSGQEAILGGSRKTLTLFFSDIAGFTSISESMDPEALVHHLAEYLGAFSEEILASGGTVDKYIGDAVMAFWGAPLPSADHAIAGCRAALAAQRRLAELRQRWQQDSRPLFFARIGLHTGEVLVGNVGSEARLNYTAIGDSVNLASRLEGLNKHYGTAILISESTYEAAREAVIARPIDWVSVKGKQQAVRVYELLASTGEETPQMLELIRLHTQALEAYRRQAWDQAIADFEAVLRLHPDDGPAQAFLKRCREYRHFPPDKEWDGVYRMEEK